VLFLQLGINLVFGVFKMEMCPVENGRVEDTHTLALAGLDFFDHHPEIEYWVEFGSLLAVLRHSGIGKWDPDVDFSVMVPAHSTSADEIFDALNKHFANHETHGSAVKVIDHRAKNRNLLQLQVRIAITRHHNM